MQRGSDVLAELDALGALGDSPAPAVPKVEARQVFRGEDDRLNEVVDRVVDGLDRLVSTIEEVKADLLELKQLREVNDERREDPHAQVPEAS